MKTKILSVALTGAFTAVLVFSYSACSPRVTIVGDKDNPIPINAEIKIHIYQHAASDVDEIMSGLDEEVEEEAPTSMLTKIIRVVQNIGVSSAYADRPDNSAQKAAALAEIKTLYREAYPFLKKGLLGENRNGYVQPISKVKNATQEDITQAAKAADKLNSARKKLYQIVSDLQGTHIRLTQEAYSTAFRSKAKKGTWIERKKGEEWVWIQTK